MLVKLLSPAGPVPLHAHPARAWARQHLGSPFGKTEAWILLDTPGDGTEPAYAGIGFAAGRHPGVVRRRGAAARQSGAARARLHRTEVHPGEVYVAHAGVPHYLGPRLSFIEVQEPSDHIVIPETSGADDEGATMGLGWDLALDMIDYGTADAATTLRPRPPAAAGAAGQRRLARGAAVRRRRHGVLRRHRARGGGRDRGRRRPLLDRDRDRGDGWAEGEFGRQPRRRGQTFAWPASLALRVRAGPEPVRIVRCLGPRET